MLQKSTILHSFYYNSIRRFSFISILNAAWVNIYKHIIKVPSSRKGSGKINKTGSAGMCSESSHPSDWSSGSSPGQTLRLLLVFSFQDLSTNLPSVIIGSVRNGNWSSDPSLSVSPYTSAVFSESLGCLSAACRCCVSVFGARSHFTVSLWRCLAERWTGRCCWSSAPWRETRAHLKAAFLSHQILREMSTS